MKILAITAISLWLISCSDTQTLLGKELFAPGRREGEIIMAREQTPVVNRIQSADLNKGLLAGITDAIPD